MYSKKSIDIKLEQGSGQARLHNLQTNALYNKIRISFTPFNEYHIRVISILVEKIHEELLSFRNEYGYLFTFNKDRKSKDEKIIIEIKNYHNNDLYGLLNIMENTCNKEYINESYLYKVLKHISKEELVY